MSGVRKAALDARVRKAEQFAKTQAQRRGEPESKARQQGQQCAEAVYEQLKESSR